MGYRSAAAVVGGSFALRVTVHGVPIYLSERDLCTVAACPLAPGPVVFNAVEKLPAITPAGEYGVVVNAISGPEAGLAAGREGGEGDGGVTEGGAVDANQLLFCLQGERPIFSLPID